MKSSTFKKGILSWPEQERPRELLLSQGPQSLSDAQLLAILLRIGRPDSSAVEVAMDVLTQLEGLRGLANRSLEELCGIPGIGPAKAAQVLAAIELGKRALATPLTDGKRIQGSQHIFQHYYPLLRDTRHEVFKAILLDAKHTVIRDFTVSQGSLPSEEDYALTQRLIAAGEILGIRVLDHIVIGDGKYVSFADEGFFATKA
jgi:DNA repair protein RadC